MTAMGEGGIGMCFEVAEGLICYCFAEYGKKKLACLTRQNFTACNIISKWRVYGKIFLE